VKRGTAISTTGHNAIIEDAGSDSFVLRVRGWATLGALLAYVAAAVAITWPLAARSGTHLLAGSGDTLFHYWNGWWVRQALMSGGSPFRTSLLFHPAGVSLVANNFAWLNVAFWLVLEPLIGGFAAYNLPLLLNLALCGFVAFLLTRSLTGDGRAAFLAGLIYQCWPSRLSQLGHPNLISTQWIPAFLAFLILAVRRGKWHDGVLMGAFLALTGYTRWQQLIAVAIVGGTYFVCSLPTWGPVWRRRIVPLLLAGGVAAVALAPPLLLLVNQQGIAPSDLLKEDVNKQTDLLAYLTPSDDHPVLGPWTRVAYGRYYADRGGARPYAAYIGVIALFLGLLGVGKARRAVLPWMAMALVLICLALGPILRVNGRLYPAIPMPYRLVAQLFVVRLMRLPDRFNMFLALPVSVLAAYGTTQVLALADRRGKGASALAVGLLGLAIVLEYLVAPVPLEHQIVSPIYARLAAESGDFAVLNLPIDEQKSKIYMFAQTFHRRPILQGHVSRLPESAHAYVDGNPWLRVLRQSGEMDPGLADVSRQLASLAQQQVRYVILHKDQVGADRVAHWQRYLLTTPRFEDAQIAVYATAPQAGRDFRLAEEMAPGIGPIRVITSTGCLNPGRVLEVDVGWGTTAAPNRDFSVELALVSSEGETVAAEEFPLSAGWPTREWPPDAVAWGYYVLRVHPSLPPGPYAIVLRLVDSAGELRRGNPYALGQVVVESSPCAFPAPPQAIGVDALFGDDLRLLGYQLHQEKARLALTLYWRSERRMQTDYKIFVHVFDPVTKVPVAQDDAMPHRWAYPTTFWGPGEVVDDVIPLSLKDVPAGVYGVAVGVYDPATMERLPVMDAGGQLRPDGRLVLPEERIGVGEANR
jgi:hypothetical protein